MQPDPTNPGPMVSWTMSHAGSLLRCARNPAEQPTGPPAGTMIDTLVNSGPCHESDRHPGISARTHGRGRWVSSLANAEQAAIDTLVLCAKLGASSIRTRGMSVSTELHPGVDTRYTHGRRESGVTKWLPR
jgi:hypothetical protein